jgi:hypothetical protein
MPENTDASPIEMFKTQVAEGGDKFIKEVFVRADANQVRWLSESTQAIDSVWRKVLRETNSNENLGAKCISEYVASLKGVLLSIERGVGADGGPVVAPPIDIEIILVIVEFYLERVGDPEEAWKQYVQAIRVAHMAKKMRGEISSSERTTSAGGKAQGCAILLVFGIGMVISTLLAQLPAPA